MPLTLPWRRGARAEVHTGEVIDFDLVGAAVKVAQDPKLIDSDLVVPPRAREDVSRLVKAIQAGASNGSIPRTARALMGQRSTPIRAEVIAQRAHAALGPSSSVTPAEIQLALQAQGMNMVEPFAPGQPLVPYYGYYRQPRLYDYRVSRNVTTETRQDRIPFRTILQLYQSYDVAQICTRHAINDLRSMKLRFEVIDGYDGKDPKPYLKRARQFMRKPDGVRSTMNWLCKHAMDVWRFDAGALYKMRDRAGNLTSLKVVSGTTLAPMLDYFGDQPTGEAPAFQQFIEGVPWGWHRADDIIYEPMWPVSESVYGTPPLETVLVNANTDLRLQLYFLQFFTAGNVPEAFATAPEDQSDPDGLADLQELWNDWTIGDQSERWGLRWVPFGTDITPYKPQQFDPDIAEYVMRRTVSAYMMVPQDLGFTSDINRAEGENQMDTQFRVNSLPNVGYYQDILDDVLQNDLGLPIQARFDTGREKEDRLMEARAHQIYVSIGAERSSEVRGKVLGYPVDPQDQTPLMYDSLRLGPVPMKYLLEISGDYNRNTGMPDPKSIVPREFVVPGMMAPDPMIGTEQATGDYALSPGAAGAPSGGDAASPKGAARKGQPEGPGGRDEPLPEDVGQGTDPSLDRPSDYSHGSESPTEGPGYGIAGLAGQQGVNELLKDLAKWQRSARKAVEQGNTPRPFCDSAVADDVFREVWPALCRAQTREEVDAAFDRGFAYARGCIQDGHGNALAKRYLTEREARAAYRDSTAARRPFGGVALRADDTGRVLMLQRAHTDGDPAAGCWEMPGGGAHDGESTRRAAIREWEEEVGCRLPDDALPEDEWDSTNGAYRGFVYSIPRESDIELRGRDEVVNPDDPDGDHFEAAAWTDPEHLARHPNLRAELAADVALVQHALKYPVHKGAGPLWGDFHQHTDTILDYFAPLIQHALAEVFSPAAIREIARSTYGDVAKGDGIAQAVQRLLGRAKAAVAKLKALIAQLYGEGYLHGAREAAKAAGGSVPPWLNAVSVPSGYWNNWTPGVGDAATKVASGGLAELLANLGIWINEITETEMRRIGDVLAEGIRAGMPMPDTAAAIAAIVGDLNRAWLIAETEYARALTVAARETYRLNNIPELVWLAQPDCCPRCRENLEASPVPTGSAWPSGDVPVHPRCRCAEAPYVRLPGVPQPSRQ
jgi:8-oxo-dGTP pyrophosphatase MutT (NUDIX family)